MCSHVQSGLLSITIHYAVERRRAREAQAPYLSDGPLRTRRRPAGRAGASTVVQRYRVILEQALFEMCKYNQEKKVLLTKRCRQKSIVKDAAFHPACRGFARGN